MISRSHKKHQITRQNTLAAKANKLAKRRSATRGSFAIARLLHVPVAWSLVVLLAIATNASADLQWNTPSISKQKSKQTSKSAQKWTKRGTSTHRVSDSKSSSIKVSSAASGKKLNSAKTKNKSVTVTRSGRRDSIRRTTGRVSSNHRVSQAGGSSNNKSSQRARTVGHNEWSSSDNGQLAEPRPFQEETAQNNSLRPIRSVLVQNTESDVSIGNAGPDNDNDWQSPHGGIDEGGPHLAQNQDDSKVDPFTDDQPPRNTEPGTDPFGESITEPRPFTEPNNNNTGERPDPFGEGGTDSETGEGTTDETARQPMGTDTEGTGTDSTGNGGIKADPTGDGSEGTDRNTEDAAEAKAKAEAAEKNRKEDEEERQQSSKNCDEQLRRLKAHRLAPWRDSQEEGWEQKTTDEIHDLLNIRVAGKVGSDFPYECGLGGEAYQPRSWAQITYLWKASALCHKPLYFENVQLERYGHSWGPYTQPLISGAHFFATIPVLPYKMGLKTPNECVYALGHYRPGSCAPYLLEPIPFTWRAAFFQAGAVVGAAAIVP